MAISLTSLRPTAPTSAGGTGSLLFDVSGLNGRAFDVYLYRQQSPGQVSGLVHSELGATNPVDYAITGQAPNSYNLVVYAVDPGQPASDAASAAVTIGPFVPAPRGGCTDPRGTLNFDPLANFEDGSCQYVPPAVADVLFEVPLLNPLRYVQVEIPDGCGTFENPDNTLFCQQQRPGQQVRPHYAQPVAYCDPVAVQVLTNFDTVEAVVHRLADGVVQRTQPLEKVLTLSGDSPFAAVELSSAGDGNTVLISATGGLPASLLAAALVTLRLSPGGPLLRYRVLRSGRASVADENDFLVLNRPWVALPGGSLPAVSWVLRGPGYNVWEALLDLSGLPPAEYEVRLHGYDAANRSATAISEPLALAEQHLNTVVLDYRNLDNAYGTVFSTGFAGRLRVRGTFFRQKNGGTVTEHRNSDGSPLTLASTAQRLIPLETYDLPAWLHEKLFVATRLDVLRVNGLTGKGAGSYDYTLPRGYPLGAGRLDVEQTQWLGTGNSDDAANETGENLLVLRTGGFLKLRK